MASTFTPITVKVKRLHAKAKLPQYQTDGAAGADVCAFLDKPFLLAPMQVAAIPTGLQLEIPHGWEIQIRPRSGLALNNGLIVPNSPGTIDSDYRGELKILLLNSSPVTFTVEPGMRVAQLVLAPSVQAHFIESHALSDTKRGKGGFGSTGR